MWLKDIDRQIEAQACSSSMTKLTPDEEYTGMYYIVHPDYLDHLIEIAEVAERRWEPTLKVHYCAVCGVTTEMHEPSRHSNACPYNK